MKEEKILECPNCRGELNPFEYFGIVEYYCENCKIVI